MPTPKEVAVPAPEGVVVPTPKEVIVPAPKVISSPYARHMLTVARILWSLPHYL